MSETLDGVPDQPTPLLSERETAAGEAEAPRLRQTRDPEELRRRLEAWIAGRLPAGAAPHVPRVEVPSSGMSSETLLFDVTWTEGRDHRTQGLVARVAPDTSAVPVFPVYDLDRQFRVIRAVRERTSVPVPETHWSEPDATHLGAPFFVMDRVDGLVPPDVMPYNFGSWLSEATPEQQSRLQDSSVRVLAGLFEMDEPEQAVPFLHSSAPGDTPLARHVSEQRDFYEWVVSDGFRSPLIERTFGWLGQHWPAHEGPTVLSWGDSRIGNIMYRDFEPVAVLDWEMAGLSTPETDLGWMIYLHRFFEDIAIGYGLPGMPGLLRRDDVAATYEAATGYAPRDLDFYLVYAALRHAIVMFRMQQRLIHFGEAERPDDPDAMIMHRATLDEMLAGTYWDKLP